MHAIYLLQCRMSTVHSLYLQRADTYIESTSIDMEKIHNRRTVFEQAVIISLLTQRKAIAGKQRCSKIPVKTYVLHFSQSVVLVGRANA